MARDWNAYAKRLLKAEMTRRQISYQDMVGKLAAQGEQITEASLRNKMSRGTFSASFMLMCLWAMNCQSLRLDEN